MLSLPVIGPGSQPEEDAPLEYLSPGEMATFRAPRVPEVVSAPALAAARAALSGLHERLRAWELLSPGAPELDLRGLAPASLIADEDVQGLASLAALRGRVDGINIKLMKCGGIAEALAMIDFARAEGWRILLGCMIETRVGLGAAAHLAGLVDDLDLDAHMLTTTDPTGPGSLSRPAADLPLTEGPGIGVEPVAVD